MAPDGELTHSIADYKMALYRRPMSASSLYSKGLAELRQGNKAEGEKDVNAAVGMAPKIADEFKQIGLVP